MPLRTLSDPELRLRELWDASRHLGADGTPLLPPKFVAEAGPRVWLVDVRADGELTGPLGHIPGIWRMPMSRVGEVVTLLPSHTPVVLVCSDGERSRTAARFLSAIGMPTVAALRGGMELWRSEGYGASRNPSVLTRGLTAPAPGHGSDGRPLVASGAAKGRHLTREDIERHLGDPSKVRRVKLAALLLANRTECVDGREDQAIIGTPGGDAGELVLGLGAVEKVTGQRVDLARVPELTRSFADTFGGIYLHTDNHALHSLTLHLRADDRFAPFVEGLTNVEQWEAFLRRPPTHLREPLLERYLEPSYVGCGHLKLMLQNPDKYEVRPELLRAFFRAFYLGLWNGATDLEWVVLGGEHAEGAVTQVQVEGDLWPFREVPMIAPSVGGVQMFVNHPQVASYLRRHTAHFFHASAASLLPVGKGDARRLSEVVADLGAQQAGHTLSALAAGLPIFTAHFAADGPVRVEAAGHVPG
jgi:rhodanese-related sulfurtransferase